MKWSTLFIFFFASIFAYSCLAQEGRTSYQSANQSNHIEVIDFYGTHRCVTCRAIEASTHYTLDNYFSEQLKNGKVVFKAVNVDEEKNYKMAEAYEATGTALFLNIVRGGKETHIDLTEFAFAKGRDQKAFSTQLKAIIEGELNKF